MNLFSHLEEKHTEKDNKRKSDKMALATKEELFQRVPSHLQSDPVVLFILEWYKYLQMNDFSVSDLEKKIEHENIKSVLGELLVCSNTPRPLLYINEMTKGYRVTT
jgi:hypothetical protein